MGRNIPIQIQENLESGASTTTMLMRIDPIGADSFGASLTNQSLVYDDGTGELEYSAYVGMQPQSLLYTNDLSIDNSQMQGLLPEYEFPISEEDIQAGVYDFARFTLYLVNYNDLTPGSHVVLDYGRLGQMRTLDGLSFWEELRGLSQQLKQTICARDSITCRARLGSQPIGTGGGVYEEREYCGIDLSTYWEDGTVLAAGAESNYSFTTTAPLVQDSGIDIDDYYAPGMVRWLTGRNTGKEQEIESNTSNSISLAFRTPFTIQAGDTFQYRRDCNKHARHSIKGCPSHWGAQWVMHFRGEPDIPIGDAIANTVPGGTTSNSGGGVSNPPEDVE
jgi:uncharacterized phage protein (TIGR02218 family)